MMACHKPRDLQCNIVFQFSCLVWNVHVTCLFNLIFRWSCVKPKSLRGHSVAVLLLYTYICLLLQANDTHDFMTEYGIFSCIISFLNLIFVTVSHSTHLVDSLQSGIAVFHSDPFKENFKITEVPPCCVILFARTFISVLTAFLSSVIFVF